MERWSAAGGAEAPPAAPAGDAPPTAHVHDAASEVFPWLAVPQHRAVAPAPAESAAERDELAGYLSELRERVEGTDPPLFDDGMNDDAHAGWRWEEHGAHSMPPQQGPPGFSPPPPLPQRPAPQPRQQRGWEHAVSLPRQLAPPGRPALVVPPDALGASITAPQSPYHLEPRAEHHVLAETRLGASAAGDATLDASQYAFFADAGAGGADDSFELGGGGDDLWDGLGAADGFASADESEAVLLALLAQEREVEEGLTAPDEDWMRFESTVLGGLDGDGGASAAPLPQQTPERPPPGGAGGQLPPAAALLLAGAGAGYAQQEGGLESSLGSLTAAERLRASHPRAFAEAASTSTAAHGEANGWDEQRGGAPEPHATGQLSGNGRAGEQGDAGPGPAEQQPVTFHQERQPTGRSGFDLPTQSYSGFAVVGGGSGSSVVVKGGRVSLGVRSTLGVDVGLSWGQGAQPETPKEPPPAEARPLPPQPQPPQQQQRQQPLEPLRQPPQQAWASPTPPSPSKPSVPTPAPPVATPPRTLDDVDDESGTANRGGDEGAVPSAVEQLRKLNLKKLVKFAARTLPANARIVDVSSATSTLPSAFARAFPNGLVYTTDSDIGWLDYISREASYEGVTNLLPVQCAPLDAASALPEPVDLLIVIKAASLLPRSSRRAFLARMRAALVPGGRALLVGRDAREAAACRVDGLAAGYQEAAALPALSEDGSVVMLRRPGR